MESVILFALTSLALSVMPGPDMIYIMARTLSQDRVAGFYSVLGITAGLVFHTFAAATGLSLIILHSAVAFMAVKLVGAVYLIVLGIKMFINKDHQNSKIKSFKPISRWRIFKQGLITNIFNPKVALFFMALLPQFIDLNAGHTFLKFIALSLEFIAIGLCVDMSVVILSDKLRVLFEGNHRFRKIQEKVTGSIMIALGLKVASYHT